MCNRRIELRKIRKVLKLHFNEKLSQEKIGYALNISRSAARDYIVRFGALKLPWEEVSELSDIELESLLFPKTDASKKPQPSWEYIHKEMRRKGATLAVLYEEFIEINPDGISYSQFCRRYKEYNKSLPVSARNTYQAGQQNMVDYAGHTVDVIDQETGEARIAQIFVGILPCSGLTYAEATWDQKKVSWINSHVRMFNYFGGTARYLIPDNLKSAVTKAGWNELVLNRTYEDMADHYGILIEPARPARPKDKSLAENAVKNVERRILFCLRNHTFFGLNELNEKIYELIEQLNNRKTKRMPNGRRQVFDELEKHELRDLPAIHYEYAEFKTQLVRQDYTINVDEHAYSVPYQYTRQKVEVKITEHMVSVYHNNNCIASHPKSSVKFGQTINSLHMPENHKVIKQWSPERLLQVAEFIGQETLAFIESLEPKEMTEISRYKTGGKLQDLVDEYGSENLNPACLYAIESKIKNLKQVENLLKHKNYQSGSDAIPVADGVSEHENIRGNTYYH